MASVERQSPTKVIVTGDPSVPKYRLDYDGPAPDAIASLSRTFDFSVTVGPEDCLILRPRFLIPGPLPQLTPGEMSALAKAELVALPITSTVGAAPFNLRPLMESLTEAQLSQLSRGAHIPMKALTPRQQHLVINDVYQSTLGRAYAFWLSYFHLTRGLATAWMDVAPEPRSGEVRLHVDDPDLTGNGQPNGVYPLGANHAAGESANQPGPDPASVLPTLADSVPESTPSKPRNANPSWMLGPTTFGAALQQLAAAMHVSVELAPGLNHHRATVYLPSTIAAQAVWDMTVAFDVLNVPNGAGVIAIVRPPARNSRDIRLLSANMTRVIPPDLRTYLHLDFTSTSIPWDRTSATMKVLMSNLALDPIVKRVITRMVPRMSNHKRLLWSALDPVDQSVLLLNMLTAFYERTGPELAGAIDIHTADLNTAVIYGNPRANGSLTIGLTSLADPRWHGEIGGGF